MEGARSRYGLLTRFDCRGIILNVSRTRKDSKQISNTVLELVAKADGTFDLLWDGKPHRVGISERWLNEELCVRYGLCGDEYDAIVLAATTSGRATRVF